MTLQARPLPPFYYVDNFTAALSGLAARDRGLFDEPEHAFIDDFARRPRLEQALIVRMALRRGPFYRGASLRYPELPDPARHLAGLKEAGWITDDPTVDMKQLIEMLPKTWLAEGFGLRVTPALCKSRMSLQASEIYPVPLALSRTHFRLKDGLYEFLRDDTCRRLCALYFGNHEQDWSEYAVADLGIRRYETVAIDAAARPFASRAEIELFHSLFHCLVLLETRSARAALASLPALQGHCDWLAERYRHVALRIARQLEREDDPAAALGIYERFESPEASWRRGIVARRLTGQGDALPRFRHRSVPHFDIHLPRGAGRRIEYQVAEELSRQSPDSELIYAENRLFNSLFGLLFWKVIFAPVRGGFFHPFHAAPADLYSPLFGMRREALIAGALAALDGNRYRDIIRENFCAKAGVLNPFVAWGWLRRPVLERALDCLPADDLRNLFDWMLADLERNTTGFPDLLQLWPTQRRYRLVEVKLGADRLQPNQRRFLAHAQQCGLPVTVCYVTCPPATVRSGRAAAPRPSRASPSLDLFDEPRA